MKKQIFFVSVLIIILILLNLKISEASYHFSEFNARPPIHTLKSTSTLPNGLSPDVVKKIYNLPKTGGSGTIAIISAYSNPDIEHDLSVFSKQFNLPECTIKNGCLEKHQMSKGINSAGGWALETALDVEWAHAIAPQAHILIVEATTPSGANLLKAIDYAKSRKDVVAVSMSWGGQEFPEETSLDSHFSGNSNVTFFASSGDNGYGVSWPAVSPNVVAVGGTSLSSNNTIEKAWSGSGGGVSQYESQPNFQKDYGVLKTHNMRAIPDVSYNADPKSGFSVYHEKNWYVVGGTSAGAPQWAAIKALGHSADNAKFYADKSSQNPNAYFRDIVSGSNGDCKYYCNARARYDFVTGLGSPQRVKF